MLKLLSLFLFFCLFFSFSRRLFLSFFSFLCFRFFSSFLFFLVVFSSLTNMMMMMMMMMMSQNRNRIIRKLLLPLLSRPLSYHYHYKSLTSRSSPSPSLSFMMFISFNSFLVVFLIQIIVIFNSFLRVPEQIFPALPPPNAAFTSGLYSSPGVGCHF